MQWKKNKNLLFYKLEGRYRFSIEKYNVADTPYKLVIEDTYYDKLEVLTFCRSLKMAVDIMNTFLEKKFGYMKMQRDRFYKGFRF